MGKVMKAIWAGFKEKPLKFGVGFFLITFGTSLSFFIFFGDVHASAEYGDAKAEISTVKPK